MPTASRVESPTDGDNPEQVPHPSGRGAGGRPRKPRSERRRHKFLVSANEAEREAIEAGAAAAGLLPAVFLRQAATGAKLGKRRDEVLYHRLSRIGVRLQQLSRQAAAQARVEEQAELEVLLQEVLDVRKTL